ncbi:transposase [Candidatus Pacearchaeota archaeon]|nr:transposase [Candidatus Pacearchaeota archaeon]
MSETRRKYTGEFKIEAVRLFENSDKSGRAIEQDLGVGSSLIYRWRRELSE